MSLDTTNKTQTKTDYEKLIEVRNTSRKEIVENLGTPEIKWLNRATAGRQVRRNKADLENKTVGPHHRNQP
jgi:hypothetical protein